MMDECRLDLIESYNNKYRKIDYFKYRSIVYMPFIKALARKAKLRKGCNILDAGCGQGYFCNLFASFGYNVLGIDLSTVGIDVAKKIYGRHGANYEVGNILNLHYKNKFDCVFVRSCSLYNTKDIEYKQVITDVLLNYVKPNGGCLIFSYATNFHPKKHGHAWIHHSLNSIRDHFSRYDEAKVYFSLRVETILLGRFEFIQPITWATRFISRFIGIGGEAICLIWRR